MDKSDSVIMIIDDNEELIKEQVLSRIIAAALFQQVQLHINTNKKVLHTESP